jgi:outer membrane autotransporter protein
VLQPDGVTAICDTSAPNPFPSSINANPTMGGTVIIPTTGASVIIQPGARISSPGAAVQVRNNSTVTNSGSISTSLINGYGIWAGDPTNSTSTTAGFGDTLQNNGSIVVTGPNAIGLFARSFNKTAGDTLINNGTITTSGSIAGISNNASSAGIRAETVTASTILNTGAVTAKGAFATVGLFGVGGDGVEMAGSGAFTNAAGASVTSVNAYGFYGNGANANGITVDNAGAISGGRAAIFFGPGLSNNSVILEPGSVESGAIDGGTASINSNLIFNGLTSTAFANAIPNWQLVSLRDGADVNFTAPSYALQNLSLASGAAATFSTPQISIGGTVANDGALTFASPNAITIAAAIQGTGTLTQSGSGILTLTGPNTYTGTTTVETGVLAAGAVNTLPNLTAVTVEAPGALDLAGFDQSIGSLAGAGAVALGSATLTTGADNTSTLFSGVISGGGALDKVGIGTFLLTGDNTYAGGTTIAGGTLQLGDGGTSGGIVGDVTNNGTLVFDRSDTVTFAGAVSGSGAVSQIGSGTTILTADNTYTGGTTIAAGTLQLGDGGVSGAILGDVTNNGKLAFDRSDTMTFAGVISGSGSVSQIGSGTTILTADSPYTGGTAVSGGTLAVGDFSHPSAALSGGGPISVASGATLGGYGAVTGPTVNSGTIAAGSATPGFSGSPTGAFTIIGDLVNQGAIQLASGVSIGNVLAVRGDYSGVGATMAINTFLGSDGSPSDKLVIDGGAATGNTSARVANIGGPGALTMANGIQVVAAIDGAATAPGAFSLANGELRAGAFNYRLFQGGVSGSSNDWFLRSSFTAPSTVPGPPAPPIAPIVSFPPDPPPALLTPGVLYPITGPELATYGVVQPLARQLGLSILGTLDDRVGDTYEPDGCAVAPVVAPSAAAPAVDLPTRKPAALPTKKPGVAPAPCPLFSPSVWGRFFGQTINNRYQAFADPRASGDMGGFQGGIDLLRGSLIAGHYERAGLYGAYGDVNADVDGLVTNPAATAYILTHTGSMNLDAWSAGGYWTHVGPGGWYLDTVLQGTSYNGSASTQFARLNTDGWGFIASLEGGVPFALPQVGPGFVVEPQGQILWQKVSFRHDYDGLGDAALGDTTGPSGRIGLRAKWTIATAGGQVWQPYLRANLWRDWGAEVDTVYSGTDIVPLLSQITLLEVGGGVTGRINANVSVFANVDYEFAVGAANGEKQNGVRGAFGARYSW